VAALFAAERRDLLAGVSRKGSILVHGGNDFGRLSTGFTARPVRQILGDAVTLVMLDRVRVTFVDLDDRAGAYGNDECRKKNYACHDTPA
jgi:hypothetical protein